MAPVCQEFFLIKQTGKKPYRFSKGSSMDGVLWKPLISVETLCESSLNFKKGSLQKYFLNIHEKVHQGTRSGNIFGNITVPYSVTIIIIIIIVVVVALFHTSWPDLRLFIVLFNCKSSENTQICPFSLYSEYSVPIKLF